MGFSKAPLRLRGLLACGVCALSAGLVVPSASAAGPAPAASSQPAATVVRYLTTEQSPVPSQVSGPLSLVERLQAVGLQDTIVPSTTGITLDLHGSVIYLRVSGPSVAAALTGLGVVAAPDEAVLPGSDAPLAEGMEVRLRRIRTESVTTETALPRPVREVPDSGLDAGLTAIESEGSDGLRVVVTEATLEDEQAVSTRTISDTIATAPVERVIRKGTRVKPAPANSPEPAPNGVQAAFTMPSRNVTAYCLTGRTATGTMAGPGSIAVDPSVIKLGSHLYVPGYGYGWATDTGGGVHGDAVDLWMTCDDAIRWGRRAVTIYVLDK